MHRLTRRDLLRHSRNAIALAALGTSSAGMAAVSSALAPRTASAQSIPAPFTRPLPIPEVITDPQITLVAREADVPVLDGAPTRMWTYNGTFPGPTIRRPSGERTEVTLVHELPAAPEGVQYQEVDTLTLHHHGAHAAAEHDGGPLPELAVHPGESRTYVYENVENGEPERAAMQWYHDHTHHRTSFNSYMGLGGLFILDDEFEAGLPLPRGDYEIPLFLTDRTFDTDNQLDTFLYTLAASTREVTGQTQLVNGAVLPYADVEPRRYRLRVHNGAIFTLHNIKIAQSTSDVGADAATADAVPMVQIGNESGLLERTIERDEILLGTAERTDVVVDFADFAGQELVLASVGPRDTSRDVAGVTETEPPGSLSGDPVTSRVLMKFRVGTEVTEPDEGPVPTELRPRPDWVAELPSEPDRVFVFGQGVNPDNPQDLPHSINGRPFDETRVDATPELDSVESWLLLNASTSTHYIHLHDVDWWVLSRNGAEPPEHERALKETFKLDPGEFVLVGTKFTDHLGAYMIHCHMLDHEDSGMMTRWDVVEPGQGQPTTMTAAEQRRADALIAACLENPGTGAPGQLVDALKATVVLSGGGSAYSCSLT